MVSGEVLIAGAGPTGLTLACDLLASGVGVRVVDKASGPSTASRALGLMPRGIEVLDRAGALGDLEQRANPIRRVVVDHGGRQAAHLRLGQTTKLVTRPGLLISQTEIEGSLRRRLGELGGAVEWSREVLHASQDADGVRVQLTDGRTARCHWMVGCDGAHSRVRNVAGIGFPGVQIIEAHPIHRLSSAGADLQRPCPRPTRHRHRDGPEVTGRTLGAGDAGSPRCPSVKRCGLSPTALDAWLAGILGRGSTTATVGS